MVSSEPCSLFMVALISTLASRRLEMSAAMSCFSPGERAC
jgi:hypothetical protein